MFESLAEKLKRMKNEGSVEPQFKDYDEALETPAPREEKTYTQEQPAAKKAAAPAMVTNTNDSDSNIELKVVRPADFGEVSDIADYLLSGCTVVLNLELLDQASTLRMLDFLNGVTYSTDGEIKNVSKSTYIITPNNVDVSDN